MDSFTHALFGANLGIISSVPSWTAARWRRVAGIGAVLAILPDGDLLFRGTLQHRAETHALFYLALAVPFFTLLIKKLFGEEMSWRCAGLITTLALFSHPFLDALNSYGTQIWLPFSARYATLNALSILDPLFSLPLLLPVIYLWRRHFTRARLWAGLALILGCGYAAAGMFFGARALNELRMVSPQSRELASPCLGTILIWRTVGLSENSVDVVYVDALRRKILTTATYPLEDSALITAAKNLPAVRRFYAHANDFVAPQAQQEMLYFRDLRYGWLSAPEMEMFVLIVDTTNSTPPRFRPPPFRNYQQMLAELRAIGRAIVDDAEN